MSRQIGSVWSGVSFLLEQTLLGAESGGGLKCLKFEAGFCWDAEMACKEKMMNTFKRNVHERRWHHHIYFVPTCLLGLQEMCCQWLKFNEIVGQMDGKHTFDGWNHQLIGNFPHSLYRVSAPSQVVGNGISAINSGAVVWFGYLFLSKTRPSGVIESLILSNLSIPGPSSLGAKWLLKGVNSPSLRV